MSKTYQRRNEYLRLFPYMLTGLNGSTTSSLCLSVYTSLGTYHMAASCSWRQTKCELIKSIQFIEPSPGASSFGHGWVLFASFLCPSSSYSVTLCSTSYSTCWQFYSTTLSSLTCYSASWFCKFAFIRGLATTWTTLRRNMSCSSKSWTNYKNT